MAEQRASGADRLAETILLDVHMERIEHTSRTRRASSNVLRAFLQ
jgi:hypothetical protein